MYVSMSIDYLALFQHNKLQTLLTLLSLLAAVMQLNPASHNVTSANMCRRKIKLVFSWSAALSALHWWTTLSLELWFQRNGEKTFAWRSRWALIDLNEKLCPCVEVMTTMRVLMDVFTKLTSDCINVTWGKTPEKHQCVWIILTSCFCHHRTNL